MILTQDGKLLFVTRFIRLFSYGMLAVVLVFYLTGIGLSEFQIGLLLTLTLAGDTAVSLALTTQADRIGRRRMLVVGAILMAGAGLAFAFTKNFLLLVLAALSEVITSETRTAVFAWYALTGAIATAAGSLFGGVLTASLQTLTLTA